jgi:hypothetical protein
MPVVSRLEDGHRERNSAGWFHSEGHENASKRPILNAV